MQDFRLRNGDLVEFSADNGTIRQACVLYPASDGKGYIAVTGGKNGARVYIAAHNFIGMVRRVVRPVHFSLPRYA